MRGRVEQLFFGTEYENIPVEEWLDGEVEQNQRIMLIMAREIIGRDIFSGLEVTAQDTVMVTRQLCGKLAVERIVYLDTEDDDEETVDHYALWMYTGELDTLYQNSQQQSSIDNFEKRFRIVEGIWANEIITKY